jgi:hypothetical protein
MDPQLKIGQVIVGKEISVEAFLPDKVGEKYVELTIKREKDENIQKYHIEPDSELTSKFIDNISYSPKIPTEYSKVSDPIVPGESLTFFVDGAEKVTRKVCGFLFERIIYGKDVILTVINDEDSLKPICLKIFGKNNQLLSELTHEKHKNSEYQYVFCIGSLSDTISKTLIELNPGEVLILKHGNLEYKTIIEGLNIGSIIVGKKFEITLFDSTRSNENIVPVKVFAQYRNIMRCHLSATLLRDLSKSDYFSGNVSTAFKAKLRSENVVSTLKVRANDKVTVKLNDEIKVQGIAQGINASDIIVGEPLKIELVDEDEAHADKQQITVEVTTKRTNQKAIPIILTRTHIDSEIFGGIIQTTAIGEMDVPESTLQVHEGDTVELVYKKSDGTDVSWEIDVHSQSRVNIQVTGGVTPGKPIEIFVTDINRIEDLELKVYIIKTMTSKVTEQQLVNVPGAPGNFRGIINTAASKIENGIEVKPGDDIDVLYLDGKGEFHHGHVTVMQPREAYKDLDWGKKYCCRAFFMPSLKPLLAELNCLELRLNYYRLKVTSIRESNKVDLIENCLKRASKNLNDNKYDLTTAWEALHEATRQEIFLIHETEAKSREYQITSEAKNYLDEEGQKNINSLLDAAKNERRTKPASNSWRGFVAEALGMLQAHKDSYHIWQNLVRDRMVMIALLLGAILLVFFYNLSGTNVAELLANNTTIKDVMSGNIPFFHGNKSTPDNIDLGISFIGDTVAGKPLVLEIKDVTVNEETIKASLSCTKDTELLCQKFKKDYALSKVTGSKGIFRGVFLTGNGDKNKEIHEYIHLNPGAKVLAKYETTYEDELGHLVPQTIFTSTRMIDANWIQKPSHCKIIIAGCLLGAIGACLSTLISLRGRI